jgi:tRNA (guanine37-N1)-methyltransferase
LKANKKSSQPSGKHASLRVSRESGETAIRTLSHRNLVDRDYKIESSTRYVFIPLTRELSETETAEFEREFGDIGHAEHLFPHSPHPPRSLKEALRDKIPVQLLKSLPTSYDIIGDIAVLDPPAKLASYEKELAQGIREVNRNVSVVLAKTGTISGQERILPVRHLAGEQRTTTLHKESGCQFKVDISKAFFSPRLSHEHERVAEQVEEGEVVTDLFSGVGPFSIMIARRFENVEVNAIDSNPHAINLLRENLALNKVKGRLNVWHGGARDVVEKHLSGKASRVIMNHPSAAQTFVDVACRALREEGGMIHYYTFAQGPDCESKAVDELENALEKFGWRAKWLAQARRVREVSPMKWQIAVDAPVAPNR